MAYIYNVISFTIVITDGLVCSVGSDPDLRLQVRFSTGANVCVLPYKNRTRPHRRRKRHQLGDVRRSAVKYTEESTIILILRSVIRMPNAVIIAIFSCNV